MNTQILLPHQFPELLRRIPSCPKKLYMQGTLPSATQPTKSDTEIKYLCVVGSRAYSHYGAAACRELIHGLAGYNICIVSGLALGIDGIAHEAALDAGLHTIAFPGSGLDIEVLYPERNHRLARRILAAGGALLSEFEMHFQATPWAFPQRNRLMAGIAHATLVIEAKEKSGTLITSTYALDFNRDVFAVPGPIFSALSVGPNSLIATGAATIQNSDDILYALGIKKRDAETTVTTAGNTARNVNKRSFVSCTLEEKIVLEILAAPLQKDELLRRLQAEQMIDIRDANILISTMELGGFIEEKAGMMFAKKITSV